jgi:hypothetical protein
MHVHLDVYAIEGRRSLTDWKEALPGREEVWVRAREAWLGLLWLNFHRATPVDLFCALLVPKKKSSSSSLFQQLPRTFSEG